MSSSTHPSPWQTLEVLLRQHARTRPDAVALSDDTQVLDYRALDALADRIACALQREGVQPGEPVAMCGASTALQAAVFVGALRAGGVPTPIAPSVTPAQFSAMVADCGARLLFVDALAEPLLPADGLGAVQRIWLDRSSFEPWLGPEGHAPAPVQVRPEDPFDIIYSSGTTGTPKGIVHPHAMRVAQVGRAVRYRIEADSTLLLATPLYSNTTLVALLPALGVGARVHLMGKFDAAGYLQLAQRLRATHTMLVPVQYARLMALPTFDEADLSAFRMKLCTSAPFDAALKADVLARWPGGLLEIYGMTEGGVAAFLDAHEHPHKLHTVGQPPAHHDLRLIDEAGRELPPGPQTVGEIVGRSPSMMTGYHGRAQATQEAEWFDAEGRRYIRSGDLGRFDGDGFLVLMGRRKDLIISGGFNLYPADLEAVLAQHPAVAEVAVVGVPSPRWGETPVAYVTPRPGTAPDEAALRAWANERLGRTQRLAAVRCTGPLPRSAIGKVLKRELRERWAAEGGTVD